jgi:hypothetical protein
VWLKTLSPDFYSRSDLKLTIFYYYIIILNVNFFSTLIDKMPF